MQICLSSQHDPRTPQIAKEDKAFVEQWKQMVAIEMRTWHIFKARYAERPRTFAEGYKLSKACYKWDNWNFDCLYRLPLVGTL